MAGSSAPPDLTAAADDNAAVPTGSAAMPSPAAATLTATPLIASATPQAAAPESPPVGTTSSACATVSGGATHGVGAAHVTSHAPPSCSHPLPLDTLVSTRMARIRSLRTSRELPPSSTVQSQTTLPTSDSTPSKQSPVASAYASVPPAPASAPSCQPDQRALELWESVARNLDPATSPSTLAKLKAELIVLTGPSASAPETAQLRWLLDLSPRPDANDSDDDASAHPAHPAHAAHAAHPAHAAHAADAPDVALDLSQVRGLGDSTRRRWSLLKGISPSRRLRSFSPSLLHMRRRRKPTSGPASTETATPPESNSSGSSGGRSSPEHAGDVGAPTEGSPRSPEPSESESPWALRI